MTARNPKSKEESLFGDAKSLAESRSAEKKGKGSWKAGEKKREMTPTKENDRIPPLSSPKSPSKIDIGDWNGRFQAIQHRLHHLMSQSDPRMERDVLDYQEINIEMINLIHDFLSASVTYGKIIIQERYLDEKEKVSSLTQSTHFSDILLSLPQSSSHTFLFFPFSSFFLRYHLKHTHLLTDRLLWK
jgi:hypothetical protein